MVEKPAMCMGYHGRACADCKRLVRDNQDENSERWIEIEDTFGDPCPKYKNGVFL